MFAQDIISRPGPGAPLPPMLWPLPPMLAALVPLPPMLRSPLPKMAL